MHELSIAIGIVDAAAGEAARRGEGRVVAVHLKLGELSGMVPEALQSAFELAREDSPLATAELVIEKVPVIAYCPTCETERRVRFPELVCPDCKSATPEVVRGRELEVVAIEVES
ncbi:MAG TPA: hydrogenase maturation nickel metallochaperone HypA [Gemmata sp.]|nr:hydrogenase maturation nickel metallochaperone HypA [Gemmata sp.]